MDPLRDKKTQIQSYQYPCFFQTHGYDWRTRSWLCWSADDSQTCLEFPATSSGRVDAIFEYLKYQAVHDALQAVTLERGLGALEVFCFKARRSDFEKWYYVPVIATRPVDGYWYIKPIQTRNSKIIIEPLARVPDKPEFVNEFCKLASQVPDEAWEAWAIKARLGAFTPAEKRAVIATACQERWDQIRRYHSRLVSFRDDNQIHAALEIQIIRHALDDQIVIDLVNGGWWSD